MLHAHSLEVHMDSVTFRITVTRGNAPNLEAWARQHAIKIVNLTEMYKQKRNLSVNQLAAANAELDAIRAELAALREAKSRK